MLPDLHTGFSRGRSDGLVFPSPSELNEIKNTLEGTNSRITEAEDRISEAEDKIVEINEAERKKRQKNQKKLGQPQGPLGQCDTPQHSNHRSPRRRRQKERP